ncbi:MAG TPA: tRNA pseudouridine(55) synthase TruB [Phycisphaerae bacterium]|nr:tRNA pseudouridine(55) synthase TruB [Phycisphaerae bacterium]
MDGVINLYKPTGVSSARHAYRLRPIVGTRKVGHAGSLDPFADGVLVVAIGRATKLVERLMGLPKLYRTTLRLGVTNATLDPEQPFEPVPVATPPSSQRLAEVLGHFVGLIDQVPPPFSAVKVGGRPAYKMAARGEQVRLDPRQVRIYQIELLGYDYPNIELQVRCGRGTYIRSLARDVGSALGTGACCQTLTRLAVGPFHLDLSVRLDQTDPPQVRAKVIGLEEASRLLADYGASDPQG